MVSVTRAKPDAVYETSDGVARTLRQVLSDAASTLGPYQPELAAEFDRVVSTLQ